jgi:NADPH:quinone reductase-like Zn-dependent oxidoreductase
MATNTQITLAGFDMANPTSTFKVVESAVPTPGAGEVLIKLSLRPVNPADVFSIMGVYPGWVPAEGTTPVPGLEGTGVVEAAGPGATKFALGQRVVGAPFASVEGGVGTWQRYLVAPESCLVAVPDAVSDDAAAQFWVNPVTVWGMLEVLAVPAGAYLLQTGAGSVLGRQVIQLCKHRGIKTINVVRRRELGDELLALGADAVIVSTEEDVAARTKEITGGEGAYGAVECVGGELFAKVAGGVRNGGTVIMYGAMSGLEVRGIPQQPTTSAARPAVASRRQPACCLSALLCFTTQHLPPSRCRRPRSPSPTSSSAASPSAASGSPCGRTPWARGAARCWTPSWRCWPTACSPPTRARASRWRPPPRRWPPPWRPRAAARCSWRARISGAAAAERRRRRCTSPFFELVRPSPSFESSET